MATSTITRANNRRQILRRRLDASFPLFADQFYARDLGQHRAYYQGQPVPAPTHPRRRRPASRPINKAAQAAFRARQLDLLAWRHPSLARRVLGAAGRFLRGILARIGRPTTTKGRTVAAPRHRQN